MIRHANFRYSRGEASGLPGFGTFTPRSARLSGLAQLILQQRWRRLGLAYAGFRRIEGIARSIARMQGRVHGLDVLRQAITLAYPEERIPEAFGTEKTLIVIGDGYGTFASLALAAFPGTRVVTINLVKTLLVDLIYTARSLPGIRSALATDAASVRHAVSDRKIGVIALRADD